ncbi:MAG: hypothetical protein KJO98_02635 [Rhodothermia bacterium]|nr:hypothetical protein [Rhodothermia bacterium]
MKRIKRTAAHGLLLATVMLVGASAVNEVMAQRGRAETGRSDKSSRVERRSSGKADGASKKAAVRNKSRSQGKAVQRGKTRAQNRSVKGRQTRSQKNAVQRGKARSENKAVQRTNGRRGDGALRESGRGGENVAGRDGRQKTRIVRRKDRSGSGDARAGKERGDSGSRRSGDRRVEDRDGRRSEVRGGRKGSRVSGDNRSIYIGDRKPDRYRRNPDRQRTGPVKNQYKNKFGNHYRHQKHYKPYRHNRRHRAAYAWCNVYHPAGHHHYVNAHIHIGSHLHIGISWPWQKRFRGHWRPRYRYRQVVYVDAGWGGHRRSSRVDVRTYYRHRVLHANDQYAEIEIEVDAIELYQNDQYLSTIDRIPGQLRKLRATVYADGRIDFDRNVFIIGDARSGFELIATRYYQDYLYNAYDSQHGYRVGSVDLRRGRVKMKKHSRLFDPYDFGGFVPISLLPDDDRLWDYGRPYLEGSHQGDGAGWYRNYREREYDYDDDYELSRNFDISYRTPQGAEIRMERSTYVDRLD